MPTTMNKPRSRRKARARQAHPVRFKPISKRKLYEILCNSRGGQWATITAVTRPEMMSPFRNVFVKVAVVKVKLKCNYTRCVNAQRRREGRRTNFKAGSLPWGEWDIDFPNSPFIRYRNRLYLRVKVERVVEAYYYTSSGRPVPYKVIRPLLRKRKQGHGQGLRHPVNVRTYLFDHIRRVSVGRERFRRTGRFEVQ